MSARRQPGTAALTLLDLPDDTLRLVLARHFTPCHRELKRVCWSLHELVSAKAFYRVYLRLAPAHALAVGPKPARPWQSEWADMWMERDKLTGPPRPRSRFEAGGVMSVEVLSRNLARSIEWLVARGVPFSPDPEGPLGLHLTREGGHAVRRIAHAADATGKAIHDVLLDEVKRHPNISLREKWMAIDLITHRHLKRSAQEALAPDAGRCHGVYALDISNGKVETLHAAAVVLASGGAGKVYRYTTNPETSTGDGIAMAWRAGCRVGNMEFIQFHPTCLYHPQERSFLITEALRGEGGILRLPDGTRFMPAHDERGELAPRDIVARAIDFEMKKHGLDHVWLDATHLGEPFLREHFPTIFARCLSLGIDIARDEPTAVLPRTPRIRNVEGHHLARR